MNINSKIKQKMSNGGIYDVDINGVHGYEITDSSVEGIIADVQEDTVAKVIVDLYEMRASTMNPLQARKMEKVQNLFQYNFFNVVIAKLSDKYNIDPEDITEIIHERHIQDEKL